MYIAELLADGSMESISNQPMANLLDNACFDAAHLINQRGVASGTVSSASNIYFIDRWMTYNTVTNGMSYTFETDGLTLTPVIAGGYFGIKQRIEQPLVVGKTYTVAAKINGAVYCASFAAGSENAWATYAMGDGFYLLYNPNNSGFHSVIVRSNGTNAMTIEWVWMVDGRYTSDTLPPYAPPDFRTELMKCMRYYRRFVSTDSNMMICDGITNAASARWYGALVVSPPMRPGAAPTITRNGSIQLYNAAKNVTPTSVEDGIYDASPSGISIVEFTADITGLGATASAYYMLLIVAGGSLALSRDL